MIYDLIIVGAGPAGISASYYAKQKGLNYLCFEKTKIASTVCDLYPHGKHLFSVPSELEIFEGSFKNVKEEKPTREELLEYFRSFVKEKDLNIQFPEVVTEISKNDLFEVNTDKGSYQGKKMILTTGNQACPRKLGLPGEDLDKVFHKLCEPKDYQNSKIVVVGGGDSAIEAAVMLSNPELHNEVILSYRKPEFFRLKENNAENIKKADKNGSVKVIFNSNLKEIKEKEVLIDIEGKTETVPNDSVFIFIGSECNTDFLEKIGLELENLKPKYNPETYETNIEGLFVAGDLTKEPLIKNAIRHSKEIVEKL